MVSGFTTKTSTRFFVVGGGEAFGFSLQPEVKLRKTRRTTPRETPL
jgi:hypothetical protein